MFRISGHGFLFYFPCLGFAFLPGLVSETLILHFGSSVLSAVIGELDETLDSQTDWTAIRADALKPVVH